MAAPARPECLFSVPHSSKLALPEDWPLPLRLLLTCMADKSVDTADDVLRLAAAMSDDSWQLFADLAIERHRVAPVLAPRLGTLPLPDPVRARLTGEIRRNAMAALQMVAETKRLQTLLGARGVKAAIFKGWPLAERLYGGAAMRHSGDLDLLIPPDQIAAGCAALADAGYRAEPHHHPRVRLAATGAVRAECREIEFAHGETGMGVELHWRLHAFRGWPDALALSAPTTVQDGSSGPITVLSDTANMMYLPMHGILHLWFRLKWLTDLAMLVPQRGPEGLAKDLAAAQALGGDLPMRLALRLVSRLFGTDVPEEMHRPFSRLDRHEAAVLASIASPVRRGQQGFVWESRLRSLHLVAGVQPVLGMLRYDTLRRARLSLADLFTGSA